MNNITTRDLLTDETWYRNWFNSSFYYKLYRNRDEKEAAVFVDNLLRELDPNPGSTMLDLGCGSGRHSKYLAAKGFDVTGIDLASSAIREARKLEPSTLRYYRHDMRVPFGRCRFDYVFNFFTSFGYFDHESDNNDVIRNIAASLRPNGVLVMDYINTTYAEMNLVPAERKEIDGVVYHITRRMDKHYFFKHIAIDAGINGPGHVFEERVANITLDGFKNRLSNHGLEVRKVFGDYNLENYVEETSKRLILVAARKMKK